MIFWWDFFNNIQKAQALKGKEKLMYLCHNWQFLCVKVKVRKQVTAWAKASVATRIYSFFKDSSVCVYLKILKPYFPILHSHFLSCTKLGWFVC